MNREQKQKLVKTIITRVKKSKSPPNAVTEIILFHTLHFHLPHNEAEKSYKRLEQAFVDWNELRVSSPWDVKQHLPSSENALALAKLLQQLLNNIHKKCFEISLENILDLPKSQIRQEIKALGPIDRSTADLILLLRHAYAVIPVPRGGERVLIRTGLLPTSYDIFKIRHTLAKLVPEDMVIRFHFSLLDLTQHYCVKNEDALNCPACPLFEECAHGLKVMKASKRAKKKPAKASKPAKSSKSGKSKKKAATKTSKKIAVKSKTRAKIKTKKKTKTKKKAK